MKIKNLLLAPIIGVLLAFSLPQLADACTGLLVGKKASTDGSVMISYAADCHVLYVELYHWPARDWPKGTMRKVVEWDTYTPLGEIPEVTLPNKK